MLKRLTNGEFVLALLVASLFWICVLVWATSYALTDPQKDACYHSAEKTGRSAEECKSFWERTTSDPVAMFTLVLAISTVGLWVATISLYRAGERQIAVAHTAANAAQKSAGVSERALIDLERAYIFVEKIDSNVAEFFNTNLAWTDGRYFPIFTLSAVNLGRTPGNIEFAVIYFDVFSQIPDEITQLHTVTANPHAESVEIIIGADKSFKFPQLVCTNGFTHSHVKEMRAGASHLYCHGLFVYRDIFNNSHTTKFCRRYLLGRDDWSPDGGRERNSSN